MKELYQTRKEKGSCNSSLSQDLQAETATRMMTSSSSLSSSAGSSEERQDQHARVTIHQPGLVHIHGALSLQEQYDMATEILKVGNQPSEGFYDETKDCPGGSIMVLNSTKTRGRMYRALDQYSAPLHHLFAKHGETVHKLACAADPSMPSYKPSTHALVLLYATNRGMGEHRDDGPNDGTLDQPVISFNLGKAVDFAVRQEKQDPKVPIRLESGDALLFGGPCRQILHSVSKIYADCNPFLLAEEKEKEELGNIRLNVTLRYAPEILGKEDQFKYFKPVRGSAQKKKRWY